MQISDKLAHRQRKINVIFLHHRQITTKKSSNPKALNRKRCKMVWFVFVAHLFVSENIEQLSLCDPKKWNILTVSQQVSCSNTQIWLLPHSCVRNGKYLGFSALATYWGIISCQTKQLIPLKRSEEKTPVPVIYGTNVG